MNRYILLFLTFVFLSLWPANAENKSLAILLQLQDHIADISEKLRDSVVQIQVVVKKNNKKYNQFGSGFVINKKGHIFTNHHVIDKAVKITIKFYKNPVEYVAKILGSDAATDVALLQVDLKDITKLKPVSMQQAETIKVGQWVIAVGNPFGFDRTVSFGIISAIGRNLPNAPVLNEFIQTDAMIAPGSSGGPLLNMQGNVIGINSRASTKGGIGFTIPIKVALEIKERILKEGTIKRGWVGLTLKEISFDLRKKLKLSEHEGILVTQISRKSDAHGRIEAFDILTAINGEKLLALEKTDLPAIQRRLSKLKINSSAKIEYLSGKNRNKKMILVKIKERPLKEGKLFDTGLGFILKEISEEIYNRYMLLKNKGLYVSYVESGSSAKQANLLRGDILLAIDNNRILTLKQGKTYFEKHKKSDEFLLQVLRGRESIYILVKR